MCARLASLAIGGYYPTPQSQVPSIAGLIKLENPQDKAGIEWAVLDPCAGDGEAVQSLVQTIRRRDVVQNVVVADADADATVDDDAVTLAQITRDEGIQFFTCEMEASRYEALRKRFGYGKNALNALAGDAFRTVFEITQSTNRRNGNPGVGLLYINPPYDTDRTVGRLEECFLQRFTEALAPGGLLVFVVPYTSLAASAVTLADAYTDLACYRFAGAEFDTYKQIVLFAKKRLSMVDGATAELFEPDATLVAQVEAWAADASTIPELPAPGSVEPRYEVPSMHSYSAALDGWKMHPLDVKALLAKFEPWHESTRARGLSPVARVLPDIPVAELMARTYEVAMPPRPAHIAAGIAAGLFNGQKIDPNDPASGLPSLLIKGVFDREWRTVEEKFNKSGDKTAEVQVQQPKLVVTVLDLDTHQYHTVASSIEVSGATSVAGMSIVDILQHYGQALMGVMERQCVILYDHRRDAGKIKIADSPRKLYAAQAHAVRANVTLFNKRPGRSPLLLGEIGSGKSTIALITGKTLGKKNFLVICPPHLLDTWRNEVAAVMPEAQVRVLSKISDVDALTDIPEDQPFVAVLSREAAKLGHAWKAVGKICPKCAMPTPTDVDFAKKRSRCEQKTLIAKDHYADLARQLALYIRPYAPTNSTVRSVLRTRPYVAAEKPPKYNGLPVAFVEKLRAQIAWDYVCASHRDGAQHALLWLFAAFPDADCLAKYVTFAGSTDEHWNPFVTMLPLLLGHGAKFKVARAAVEALPSAKTYYGYGVTADSRIKRLDENTKLLKDGHQVGLSGCKITWTDGAVQLDGIEVGSAMAVARLLEYVTKLGAWSWTEECGEPLFAAIPEPRRYPLSRFIVQRHKHTFDFLIVDEAHEFASENSAQGHAAHRLATLKIPILAMTGSIMNGYATSLFSNMWSFTPEFREEFDRTDLSAFNDRYGYRKRVIQDRADGEVVSFGSQTDRVERSERDAGTAPGVLPLFLFRHLLPSAVTIHKADLQIDLPACTQTRIPIQASAGLHAEYKRLLKTLVGQIKADRFKPEIAGKLFGALSELPSYLDRATADVGNGEGGAYEIRYPEACGGALVASAPLFPASTLLDKEEWLIRNVESELADGRNVMVFAWHVNLLPRLSRLIETHLGVKAPVLYSDKVPTAKRQAWIDREIVQKGVRVMVTNPVAIQTGLNNLVHFSTELWHENPACNPIVYRQASGRIDRIGQKLPTKIIFGHYADTLQSNMYDLLIAKVAISTATDGLDPESALRASGIVEDEYLTGLSIGKQLWAMLSDGYVPPKVVVVPEVLALQLPVVMLSPEPIEELIVTKKKVKESKVKSPKATKVKATKVKATKVKATKVKAAKVAKAPKAAKAPKVKVPKKVDQSQGGPALCLSVADLNEDETKVLKACAPKACINDIAKEAFNLRPDAVKAKSRVRNALRRLVRSGMVKQVDRGTYAKQKLEKAA